MTTIITQPNDQLEGWAATPTFPAGTDPWSGAARVIEPTTGEIADGFVPDEQPPAEVLNWQISRLGKSLDALADITAVNWTRNVEAADVALTPPIPGNIANCADPSDGSPFLLCLDGQSAGGAHVYYSRDGERWVQGVLFSSSGSFNDIQGIGMGAGAVSGTALILQYRPLVGSFIWQSTNGGRNFTGPISLPGSGTPEYTRLAINPNGTCIAMGSGYCATSVDRGSTWTLRSSGLLSVPTFIVCARPGESGVGFLVNESAGLRFSLVGSSTAWGYTDLSSFGSNPLTACWSESHQLWFVLLRNGKLVSSPTVDGSWTLVAQLGGTAFPSPQGWIDLRDVPRTMIAWGRNLVILGTRVSAAAGDRSGSVLVYDPSRLRGFAVNAGDNIHTNVSGGNTEADAPWQCMTIHDGRIVLARNRLLTSSSLVLETAFSMRAPWTQE